MAIITTHPGGLYYEWRVSVVGSPPPHMFDENADAEGVLYHAWQHGVPKDQALSDYIQRIGIAAAGIALTLPVSPASGLPSSPPPAPAPAPAVATVAAAADIGLTSSELVVADILLNRGLQLNAPRVALAAILAAAAGETAFGSNPRTYMDNGAGFGGVLQGSLSAWPNLHDTDGMALAFYTGRGPQGQGDFRTGAIPLANQGVTDPEEIAIRVEVPSIWPDDAYARNAGTTSAVLAARSWTLLGKLLPGLPPGGPRTPPRSPTTRPTPAPTSGGVFDLFKQINWAGDFENLWKYVMGGANEAANMAKLYNERILEKLDFINWPH